MIKAWGLVLVFVFGFFREGKRGEPEGEGEGRVGEVALSGVVELVRNLILFGYVGVEERRKGDEGGYVLETTQSLLDVD